MEHKTIKSIEIKHPNTYFKHIEISFIEKTDNEGNKIYKINEILKSEDFENVILEKFFSHTKTGYKKALKFYNKYVQNKFKKFIICLTEERKTYIKQLEKFNIQKKKINIREIYTLKGIRNG